MEDLNATAALLTVLGVLLVLAGIASPISNRLGVPVLVVFLGLGMLAGSEGLGGIHFDDYGLAFRLGTIALVLILFDGALNTSPNVLRRAALPAALLATVAVLATAGDLLFWGDIGQVLRAFDPETGKVLWQSEPLGATVQTSTITYAVDGKQYVAVVNAESLLGAPRLAAVAGATIPPHRVSSINVFALPR